MFGGIQLIGGWGLLLGPLVVRLAGTDEAALNVGTPELWDGTRWRIPPVYSDEPCLARKIMAPPAGVTP